MTTNWEATNLSQVESNYEAFKEKLPELMSSHPGMVAVLHDRKIVQIFDTYADAVRFGQDKFGNIGIFSVQEITNKTANLGFYSQL